MVYGLVSILVVVLLGIAATLYLRKIRQPREETAAGITAMAGMSWRDFITLVLAALGRRGYIRVYGNEGARDDSEYLLERDGKRFLLSCKHGSAFILGLPAVHEIVSAVRLQSAAGGLLLTQGKIADEVRPVAALQRIELLDGPTLWPEMQDLISDAQRSTIRANAERVIRRHTLSAWAGAAVIGIVIFALSPRSERSSQTEKTAQITPPAPAQVEAPPTAAQAVNPPIAQTPAAMPDAADEATLAKQRSDVAHAISTLPMVDRAIWSTQSTLQVFLTDAKADAIGKICPLLERYPSLAASRVQLTPPVGSDAPVRFRQCRAY